MSFKATLYDCADDPGTYNKILPEGSGTEISSITPTASCDILNPTFILNYDSDYVGKNYIIVDDPFNRAYFITDMKIDIGKKIVISCAVDVLQTYKEQIGACAGYIVRNGHAASMNRYLADNTIPIQTKTLVHNVEFDSTPFTVYDADNALAPYVKNYVLTVIGGGQ